jgi:hypothetical protein
MTRPFLSTFLIATALLAGTPTALASPRTEVQTTSATTDAEDYAAREARDEPVAEFRGGGELTIVASSTAVIIMLIILVILL